LGVLPDRTIPTLTEFFRRNVILGTTLKTDGYPSYPRALRNCGINHLCVSHVDGFVTSDGVHTNPIENIWSHLKKEYRTRFGINKERIQMFFKEFRIN
jgi:hypothetical protein